MGGNNYTGDTDEQFDGFQQNWVDKINEFKDFLINKPANVDGYNVFISCSDDSLFGSFYQVIETCDQSGNAAPYIHIQ